MSSPILHKNIFLTDENVDGPAIIIALAKSVDIIRDVDTDVPCDINDYDQCLFQYAIEHNYVLVTGNNRDFEWQFYKYAETGKDHPGLLLIQSKHNRSSYLIAEWLELLSDMDLTNTIFRI
jgi:hypothetical protein